MELKSAGAMIKIKWCWEQRKRRDRTGYVRRKRESEKPREPFVAVRKWLGPGDKIKSDSRLCAGTTAFDWPDQEAHACVFVNCLTGIIGALSHRGIVTPLTNHLSTGPYVINSQINHQTPFVSLLFLAPFLAVGSSMRRAYRMIPLNCMSRIVGLKLMGPPVIQRTPSSILVVAR